MAPQSENGWEPPWVGADRLEWTTVPGTSVTLQIMKGIPLAIMRAFAADYNAFVEPLRDPDSACYTPTNSVSTSNHLNGTGMDMNWNTHPFRKRGTFTNAQMAVVRELLDYYEDTMFWAGDWTDPIDEMHWQMDYGTFQDQPRLRSFIARKIRADGYSTFRRGNTPSNTGPAEILAAATGLTLARAVVLAPLIAKGLALAECTNPSRIAMWLAQIGHESDNFNATAEYASGDAYDTRTDLGNTPEVDGDGRLYKGRTWIQITGKYNFASFSRWAFGKGLVPTPTYFVDNPLVLSDMQYAAIGPAWYWTVARANLNPLSDRRDLRGATYLINGGYNGLDDRQKRYNLALAQGDRLLELLQSGDDMASVPQEQWDRVYREQTQEHESLSGYRTPGEGKIGTWCTIDRNDDLMIHEVFVEWRAMTFGHKDSVARIIRSAYGLGADTSADFVDNAKAVLSKIPADHIRAALAWLEQSNPSLLQAIIKNGASK
ncbi:glycoside hydrolase family 19 protein [Mycobacteroides chelonae]|uniref:glycoside hydrolase family 19 protein n=1 Tax=Mycobacteroides chelonae TaxID=1774 RepID=UPI0005C4AD61|nr:M15 family metallopeptidase [Mycobacteroides chelonae]OHT67777.1 hypothetical protein BKG66_24425 [Mycobacteroides chelonae]OHT69420.1 hypothetical protein BKG67_22960 [Mycobacteroides chelonae]